MAKSTQVIKSISLWLVCILQLVGVCVFAAEPSAPKDSIPKNLEELKVTIEKIRVETGLPALGVALVDKNGPIWVAGLGEANKETHAPATENSLFRVGSTSKMFVALSVLKLVEEGKLHLDDKLRDLAPEVHFENLWESEHPVQLVHLLEHTTGWDDASLAVLVHEDTKMSLKEAIDYKPMYRKSRWVPGTRFSYNNSGPAISAYIVEKITGKPFEQYVQENFFNPLQMNSASFLLSDLVKKNGVTLYSQKGEALHYWNLILRPSGALNASPKDMANFLQFLVARGEFNQLQLLSKTSFDRMETTKTTLGAQAGTKTGYGLHNYVTGHEDYGIAFHGHDGDVEGGHNRLGYVPSMQVGYSLMFNQDNIAAIDRIQKVMRSYIVKDVVKPQKTNLPLPPEFRDIGGYYIPVNPRYHTFRLLMELAGAKKIVVDGNVIHRSAVFGPGEPSNDIAYDENTLTNSYTGLPNIALVNDPLLGKTLAVDDDMITSQLMKVSPFNLFGKIGLVILVGVLSVSSILFAMVWVLRLLLGKLKKGVTISLRLWPLLTTLVLMMALFTPQLLQPKMADLGSVSPASLCIYIFGLLYPFVGGYSLINLIRHREANVNRLMYWYSVVVTLAHLALACLFASYGFLGVKLWE